MMSPDVQKVLEAIETIQGHSLVPENTYSMIYHFISSLGSEAIYDCAGKSEQFKIGYIQGYALASKEGRGA